MNEEYVEFDDVLESMDNFIQDAERIANGLKNSLALLKQFRNPTLIIIKPHAHEEGLSEIIIEKLTTKGFLIKWIKVVTPTEEQMKDHYFEHKDKPFFNDLIKRMTSGPITTAVIAGPSNTLESIREIIGVTDPKKAKPETIRGEYGKSIQYNVIHASDSKESFRREFKIWYDKTNKYGTASDFKRTDN